MSNPQRNQTDGLTDWIIKVPGAARTLRVATRTVANAEILFSQDAEAVVTANNARGIAEQIITTTYEWTDAAGTEGGYVAQWLDVRETVLSSYQWRCEPRNQRSQFNGSIESILAQTQQNLHAVMRLHLEGMQTIKEIAAGLMRTQQGRIETLERRVADREQDRENLRAAEAGQVEAAIEAERFERLLTTGEKIVTALLAAPADKPADKPT